MAAHEFRQRMHDDVRAVFDRPHQHRRRHRVVDDQRHVVAMRDIAPAPRGRTHCRPDCRRFRKISREYSHRSALRDRRRGRISRSAPACPSSAECARTKCRWCRKAAARRRCCGPFPAHSARRSTARSVPSSRSARRRRPRVRATRCSRISVSIFQRVDFEFGEDASLRIQQQRQRATAFVQIFDVVGDDRVQVAQAIRPREIDNGVPVGIEDRERFARGAVFVFEVEKVSGSTQP